MPGLLKSQFCPAGSMPDKGIWSKHRADISAAQLHKFWSELSPQARYELLKIDKHALFERARRNLYCSRCNGLLLEGFSQIVMYGKSLQLEDVGARVSNGTLQSDGESDVEIDERHDPAVHPWGGLATTRDGILTLLDCFINSKSLKALQHVFDNARARERERELLYPDACGGGGRGWISQGIACYGRGHGTRDTCALHNARLSCDTLVDFWSALSDDTRLSLLRMKEEDFIEKLMHRFDSKRFCRDCRRNVIREFKELKELKRMRREPHCSSWFCVADIELVYEVSEDTVQVDWQQSFTDSFGTYHRFEWAVGTGEGKSDILDFEDVGMLGKVHVNGLDLGGLSACFITVRAWKLDGRCAELCVKAHALKGKPCVHRKLIVGDGFVTMTQGDSIRSFFEHAEEAEEEEDDDAMDKDGNEYDDDILRPQKHAKSPELAREFLLDAATVIFKEQVEKAFREGTARQNAHSIFVCLALKLLEERIHVACKEIITLEKQTKLLEEEEREKREEEERKERRRLKEREKKHRRKERLKGKEREREQKYMDSDYLSLPATSTDLSTSTHDDSPTTFNRSDSVCVPGDLGLSNLVSPDSTNKQSLDGCINSKNLETGSLEHECHVDEETNKHSLNGCINLKDLENGSLEHECCVDEEKNKQSLEGCINSKNLENGSLEHGCHVDAETNCRDGDVSFIQEQLKPTRWKLSDEKDFVEQPSKWFINGAHRSTRERVVKTYARNCHLRPTEKFQCYNGRTCDRHNFHSCSCNQQEDRRVKDGYHNPTIRSNREMKTTNKTDFSPDVPKPLFHGSKYNQGCYAPDSGAIPRGKFVTPGALKQVWEPVDARKKLARSISDPDITSTAVSMTDSFKEAAKDTDEHHCELFHGTPYDDTCSSGNPSTAKSLSSHQGPEDSRKSSNKSDPDPQNGHHNGFVLTPKSNCYLKDYADEEAKSCPSMSSFPTHSGSDATMSSSSSDNCLCLSEGDVRTGSSSPQNEGSSSTSDSEDASPNGKDKACHGTGSSSSQNAGSSSTSDSEGASPNRKEKACHTLSDNCTDFQPKKDVSFSITTAEIPVSSCTGGNFPSEEPASVVDGYCNGRIGFDMAPPQHILPMHNQSLHAQPFYPSTTMGYYNQIAPSWSAAPLNGFMPYAQPNHYVYPSPYGYGLTANQVPEFQMQYSAVQPMATSLLSLQQHHMYQTTNAVYVANSKEQIKNSTIPCVQQIIDGPELSGRVHPLERLSLDVQLPSEALGETGSAGDDAKPCCDAPAFSLFHFGDPIAGAAGCNTNPVSLKDTAKRILTCSAEDSTIQEYSLFGERRVFDFHSSRDFVK